MHHMTVVTPPLGALVDRGGVNSRRGIGGAVGDASGEAGLLGAEQRLPHHRMNAIRADDQHRFDAAAVGKRERDAGSVLLDRDQLFAEVDAVGRRQGSERRMQARPVDHQIRCAVALLE